MQEILCKWSDYYLARSEVLTKVLLKIQVFWDVTLHKLVNNYPFITQACIIPLTLNCIVCVTFYHQLCVRTVTIT